MTTTPRTVPPQVARELRRHHGAVASTLHSELTTDVAGDPLGVHTTVAPPALVQVPRTLGVLRCDDCDAEPEEDRHDPLDLPHAHGCILGDELGYQLDEDVWRLARRGVPLFHRAASEAEQQLLDSVGLRAERLLEVHAVPASPPRRRVVVGLEHQAALVHNVIEAP